MAKKRRTRTGHPGVKLRSRTWSSGESTWFARWIDPDTHREVDQSLDRLGLRSDAARRAWAVNQSRSLAARRAEIAAGKRRVTRTDVQAAVETYLDDCRARLRKSTVDVYAEAVAPFAAWLEAQSVERVEAIDAPLLARWRKAVIAAPRQRGSGRRSPATVNRLLRCAGTMLADWRRLGLLPRLDADAVADAVRALPEPHDLPEYLRPEDLRRLLEAALRHDDATFDLTRAEKSGEAAAGSTHRHPPIAPFVVSVLLTGGRVGEVLGLRWPQVDLEALDEFGQAVGEVRLDSTATKTHRARSIDLAVSPALRTMLGILRLRRRDEGAHVFELQDGAPYTKALVNKAALRLRGRYGAPAFTWQLLRSTCDTYLVNSHGIFGGASAYRAARQMGHSVTVAEKHYQGLVRGIPRDARTLEAAMQIESMLGEIIARARGSEPGGEVRLAL